ncbi:MAG: AAA family ATPase [Candidatus Nephrothrix sp. EaCA]|nr:MAG: AAA family ATPase [Candidatus Nephrothrix sp. EaCA]
MIFISQIKNVRPYDQRCSYPHNIPSVVALKELEFHKPVTFIIGENGSGKSTLIEAIAINAGFNPEGGGRNFSFNTNESHSELFQDIRLIRTAYRNKDGFFLRAESFYNVASEVDKLYASEKSELEQSYGGSLHARSHGESFLALLHNRLIGHGLYIFDEPESALSIISQFNMLTRLKQLVDKKSQFIIATHSPVLMAYPDADIYCVSENGLQLVNYEDTEQYKLTKYFMNNYQKMLGELGLL